jgi:excisionase family DNA binding protein
MVSAMGLDRRETAASPVADARQRSSGAHEVDHDLSAYDRLALSVEETAVVLGIGRSTAWRMVRAGVLPARRLGRRVLVPRAALEEWLAREVN